MLVGPLGHAQGKLVASNGLRERFDSRAAINVLFSPYRLCPLGAHVDHQHGAVLACAIDHGIYLGFQANQGQIRLASEEFDGTILLDLTSQQKAQSDWGNYARGAVAVLGAQYPLSVGFDAYSVGARSQAGLSSSASIGVAYLQALAHCNNINLSPTELVRLDEQIETEFLGLKNGILDPAAIVFGQTDKLIHIDTSTCDVSYIGSSAQYEIVALHSGIQEALTPSNFNLRVEQSYAAAKELCELAGVEPVTRHTDGMIRLGDVDPGVYQQYRGQLEAIQQRRADHYFSEVHRVEQGIVAFEEADMGLLGSLLQASSRSSIHNYECGATPVKVLVELLNSHQEVYGARFCGPGFRGCCIALVKPGRTRSVVSDVYQQYGRSFAQLAAKAWALSCQPSAGLQLL